MFKSFLVLLISVFSIFIMRKYLMYFMVVFPIWLFISCKNDIKDILSSSNGKYWAVYSYQNGTRYPNYFFIKSDGTWIPYEQKKDGLVRRWNNEYDQKESETWRVNEDSTVLFGVNNEPFRYKVLDDNNIELYNKGNNKWKLVRVNDFKEYSSNLRVRYQSIIDSLSKLEYNIVVSDVKKRNSTIFLTGHDIVSSKVCIVSFPDDIKESVSVCIGDTVSKGRDLIIKISSKTNCIYCVYYTIYNKPFILNVGHTLDTFWLKKYSID